MGVPDHIGGRRRRALAITIVMSAVLLVLAIRLFDLQIVRGEEYAWQARENMIRHDPIPAARGRIFDRHGRLLAGNRVCLNVNLEAGHPAYADTFRLRDAALMVGTVLGRDPAEIATKLRRNRNRFEPVVLARDLTASELAPLIERLDPIPGLSLGRGPVRYYPGGTLGSHLLGYVGEVTEDELRQPGTALRRGMMIGRCGLEKQYDNLLRGTDGATFVEVDALGRKTDLFPERPPQAAIPGADLHLYIDGFLQAAAESSLSVASIVQEGATVRGAVVALDPRNGEVLVYASAPPFDLNAFTHGISAAEWAALTPDRVLLDRAVQAAYPPGSVFKIVTSLAGLSEGVITEQSCFAPCHGSYHFGNRPFRCWRPAGHGTLNLRSAFEQSCDVYFYQLGHLLGVGRLLDFANRLAIDGQTGVDIPEERSGLIPDFEWYRSHVGHEPTEGVALNLAIGQGEIMLTPIEIATFVSALVTDGRVWRPRIASYARQRDGLVVWSQGDPEFVRDLPVSVAARETLRGMLRQVVEGERGTGSRARVEGQEVGGKTGTAQNPHGADHALFVSAAPIEAPEIVVVAVVEAAGHGGTMAAPVAQAVLQGFFDYGGEGIYGPQPGPGLQLAIATP